MSTQNAIQHAEEVAATIRAALAYVPAEGLYPCTNCGMAPMAAPSSRCRSRGRDGAQGDVRR
jgi:5-methyltetrahydropteroyltriglutamate--homocysteine methyltransferase